MKPVEIIANFLKKDQRVLHLGGSTDLGPLMSAYTYTHVNVDELNNWDNIPTDSFDYVVLDEVLELVEDPSNLIRFIKNKAKSTVIYEFKYDEDCHVEPEWKQPWKTQGLEFLLTREFDFVNDIFLGYATLHICEMPYNGKPEDKEHPDAIR